MKTLRWNEIVLNKKLDNMWLFLACGLALNAVLTVLIVDFVNEYKKNK